MKYIPLCTKSDYSLLKSLIKIDDLINFSLLNNIKVCGICDDNLSGAYEFFLKCKNENLKPIIGLEVEFLENTIYLYAKDEVGFLNLIKINSLVEDDNLSEITLAKYSKNIVLVIPFKSVLVKNSLSFFDLIYFAYENDFEKKSLSVISKKIVFMNQVKYFNIKDKSNLEILNKLGGKNDLTQINHVIELDDEDYKLQEAFCKNINLGLTFNKLYIPKFKKDVDSFLYLSKLATEGLKKRLRNKVDKIYIERLNYELDVIKKMDFTDYFLICYDYVLFAKKNNILVGPGRGSSAGSLVCYATGITEIDPIKYNLLFERFLNVNRVGLPDIDIDVDSEKREEIIQYIKEKYGDKNTAIVLTYNTYQCKLILRELAKVFDVNNSLVDSFLKEIPNTIQLKDVLKIDKVKRFIDFYPELKNLYIKAKAFEGLKKNLSHHAAGIVISKKNLDEIIPVKKINDTLTTGITMDYLEKLGLIKMDLLALRNLTTIANIISATRDDVLKNLDLNKKEVYELFGNIKTDGIFQFETYSMKKLLEKLKPDNFEELSAALALVRPGPNIFLDDYVKNKKDPKNIKYDHPILENILKETYGVIIYQEQVINILNTVGSFSNTEADLIRRAMSKKDSTEILKQKNKFIKNAESKGISEETSTKIYEKITRFSMYGFNKSHSVAYALVAYQMAYLKTFYKKEFYTEYFKQNKNIKNIIYELKALGYEIVSPDINLSKENLYFEGDRLILPLTLIKGVMRLTEEKILKHQPFNDFFEFLIKTKITKDEIEALALANVFGSINLNKREVLNNFDIAYNYSLLGEGAKKPLLEKFEDFPVSEIDIFGFYIGNHPSLKYSEKEVIKLKEIENYYFKNIIVAVVIEFITFTKTKKGDEMAFIDISDETDSKVAISFKETVEELKKYTKGDLVIISGKVSKTFDKTRIIINNIKRG